MLAEAVSLDGGALIVILILMLLALAVVVAVAVLGSVFAFKAGKGSERALVGWLVVVAVEVASAVPILLTGGLIALSVVPGAVLLIQVALFFWARNVLPPGR